MGGFPMRNLCLIAFFLSLSSLASAQEIKEQKLSETQSVIEKKTSENKEINFTEPQFDVKKDKDFLSDEEASGKPFSSRNFTFPKKFTNIQNISKNSLFSETNEEISHNNLKKDATSDKKWEIPTGSTEYGAEFGFAPDIATWMSGPKPWDISGHRQLLASVRWGKIIGTKGIVTFSYAFEFIPLSLAIGNEVKNKNYAPGSSTENPTKRETTYGFVINPASFRFIFLPKLRLRPFIGSGIGPSYHVKPIPIPTGTRWNLMIDFQIGGQYMLSKTRAIQFGYRYFHQSNVYLSDYNPGYNTNVYFIGYSIFKK